MKTNPLLRSIALLGSLALPTTLHAMEVHEWGTFTKNNGFERAAGSRTAAVIPALGWAP
jgi:hypothetical protein